MTYAKILSALLGLSVSALAQAASVEVKVDSVGPIIDTNFTSGGGRVIASDWFAFFLSIDNASTTNDFVIPVSSMTVDFGAVGRCAVVTENPSPETIVVHPGEHVNTVALYCEGLKTNGKFQQSGTLSVTGTIGASETYAAQFAIQTN